jgi:hypothetical protein
MPPCSWLPREMPSRICRADRRVRSDSNTQQSEQSETLMERSPNPSSRNFLIGTAIEVRGHFRGEWSRGFEVAEETQDGYWVRRMSDRYVLPLQFSARDVRRDLRRAT